MLYISCIFEFLICKENNLSNSHKKKIAKNLLSLESLIPRAFLKSQRHRWLRRRASSASAPARRRAAALAADPSASISPSRACTHLPREDHAAVPCGRQ
jgi:hypothetical protein